MLILVYLFQNYWSNIENNDLEFQLKKNNKNTLNMVDLDLSKIELIKRNLQLINQVCEDDTQTEKNDYLRKIPKFNTNFDKWNMVFNNSKNNKKSILFEDSEQNNGNIWNIRSVISRDHESLNQVVDKKKFELMFTSLGTIRKSKNKTIYLNLNTNEGIKNPLTQTLESGSLTNTDKGPQSAFTSKKQRRTENKQILNSEQAMRRRRRIDKLLKTERIGMKANSVINKIRSVKGKLPNLELYLIENLRKDRRSNDKKGSWKTQRIGHKNNNSNVTEKYGEFSHYEECKSQDSTQKATFANKNLCFTHGKRDLYNIVQPVLRTKSQKKENLDYLVLRSENLITKLTLIVLLLWIVNPM